MPSQTPLPSPSRTLRPLLTLDWVGVALGLALVLLMITSPLTTGDNLALVTAVLGLVLLAPVLVALVAVVAARRLRERDPSLALGLAWGAAGLLGTVLGLVAVLAAVG